MLSKLLKYDFKSLFKILIPTYGIVLLLSLFTRLSNTFVSKLSILSIPNGFISALYVIVLIGLPIITSLFVILKFYNNLVKDEGYLMHTLPVKENNIVLSKTISGYCVIVLSTIISVILLIVGVYGLWFKSDVFDAFKILFTQVNKLYFWLIIVSMLLSILFQQLMFYASIALGQKHNSNKGIFSIIYLVILYIINQVAGLLILIPMFISPTARKYLNSDTPPMHILNNYLICGIIISIIFIIAYYFLTVKVLDKKLNLE